eukprot:5973564-Prymnesium_polylepis.1
MVIQRTVSARSREGGGFDAGLVPTTSKTQCHIPLRHAWWHRMQLQSQEFCMILVGVRENQAASRHALIRLRQRADHRGPELCSHRGWY